MSDLATAAHHSLSLVGLSDDEVDALLEASYPPGSPTVFTPFAPSMAFAVLALSRTTPRSTKLGLLQHWATNSDLRSALPRDAAAVILLTAAAAAPEILDELDEFSFELTDEQLQEIVADLDPSVTGRVNDYHDSLAEYAENVGEMVPPTTGTVDAYVRAVYEQSVAHHERVRNSEIIEFEEWEQPVPACTSTERADGAVCFHIFFTKAGVSPEQLKRLTEPLHWPGCGDGFWISVKDVGTYAHVDVYQEVVQLLPGVKVAAALGTTREDNPPESYCLRYWLIASPDLAIDEGHVCVRANATGVDVDMVKCVRWENEYSQGLLEHFSKRVCSLMLSRLQEMAEDCQIDPVTAGVAASDVL